MSVIVVDVYDETATALALGRADRLQPGVSWQLKNDIE